MTHITSVTITDILGIEHAAFQPGTLTVIHGENGAGKSSILQALMAIFEGGHDPNLLRIGAKRGQIILSLDTGASITKTITQKASTVEVLDPQGNPVPGGPQTFIRSLGESWAVDPGALLRIDAESKTGAKQLVEHILGTLGLTFSAADVAKATGVAGNTAWPLESLQKLREELHERRRVANKAARDAEGAVKRLQASLPPVPEVDLTAESAGIEKNVTALGATADAKLGTLADQENEEFTVLKRKYQHEREEIASQRNEAQTGLRVRLAEIRETQKAQERAKGAQELIKHERTMIRQRTIEADDLTLKLDALDALKRSKLEALPIPGLGYEEGQITVDGVPWTKVNTARKVDIACQIAARRAGDLPFIVLDDAEHFDSAYQAVLEEWARASGFQVLTARVTEGPLTIEVAE